MPVSKLGKRRQVVIPKEIFDQLGLQIGDYLEAKVEDGKLVYIPKQLVDRDDLLTSEDEESLRRGLTELERGETSDWEEVKERLKL
jgi:AbrB family looped-hinge helix DNA binding protein